MAARPSDILLVEDETIIALGTKQLLEARGFRVTTAHTAAGAVSAARERAFDLVLMDIDLGPGEPDGPEVAARLLEERTLPIVYLTCHSEKEIVERVRGITAYGYVLKNSGEFVLLQSIETALELFRAHQALEEASTRKRETEERYQLVVRHAEEAITLFDTEGRVLLMNEKAAENLGGKPRDFSGKRLSDFLPPAEADHALAGLQLVLERRESSVSEWEVHLPDGPHWFRSRIYPVLDDDGVVLSLLSSSLDITEQVRSAKLYQLVVEHMGDVVASCDSEFNLTYLSPSSERLFGFTMEDFRGMSGLDVIHPEDRHEIMESIGASVDRGERYKVSRFRVITREGRTVWVESTATFLYGETNALETIVAVARDITDQVATEQALAAAERSARIVADSVPILVYAYDFNTGRNSWANRAHREYFKAAGFEGIAEAEGERVLSAIHPEDREPLFEQLRRATAAGYNPEDTITLRCWNGTGWDWFLHRHCLLNTGEGGEPHSVLGVLTPINELKRRENEATVEMQRRDLLWQEINHRVKNNLTLVSSLLSLQEQAIGVDLSGARRQIEAVSQVHHLLSEEAGSGAVDIARYARAVVDSLRGDYEVASVELDAPRITIASREAVMVGLILNELVTNALKHGRMPAAASGLSQDHATAATSGAPGRVEVRLTGSAEELTVAVSNDGPYLPESFDITSDAGLGLQLVQALAAQGGGSLEARREPRTEFAVTLNLSQPGA